MPDDQRKHYADLTFEITYGNVPSKQPGEVPDPGGLSMTVKKCIRFASPSTARPSRLPWKTKGYKQQDAYDALKALEPFAEDLQSPMTTLQSVKAVKTDPGGRLTAFYRHHGHNLRSAPARLRKAPIPNIVGYQQRRERGAEAAGFVVTAEYDDESDKDENTCVSVSRTRASGRRRARSSP